MESRSILRWTRIGGLVVVCLALATLFWLRARAYSTATLSDGSQLILEGVSYDKEHRFYVGSGWERWLAPFSRFLPSGIRLNRPMTRSTTNNTLCIWIRQMNLPQGQKSHMDAYIVDEHSVAAAGYDWSMNRTVSPAEQLRGYGFAAFPRRGKKMFLQFHAWDSTWSKKEMLAEFEIPNPVRESFTEMTPEPMPVTRRDGEMEFTLTKLHAGLSFRQKDQHAPVELPSDSAALAAFVVRNKGQVVTNWQPVKIYNWDATGNRSKNSSWSNSSEGEEQQIIYQWGLWPDEPAWRLRVEFSRTSGFLPGELWTVKGISTAESNMVTSSQSMTLTNAIAVTNLHSHEIAVMPLQKRSRGSYPFRLQVNINPKPEGWRLTLVSLVDEQGEPVPTGGKSWGGGEYKYDLKDLEDVESLTATLALHPSRFVEFIAKPERVR